MKMLWIAIGLLLFLVNSSFSDEFSNVSSYRSEVKNKRFYRNRSLKKIESIDYNILSREYIDPASGTLSIDRFTVGIANEPQIDRHTFGCLPPSSNGEIVQAAYVVGDPEFSLVYTNYPIWGCPRYADVKFHATEAGEYSAYFCLELFYGSLNLTVPTCMKITGTAVADIEEPEVKDIFCSSVVRNDSRSVSESIPIQGSTFSLVYSSNYSDNFRTSYPKPSLSNSFNYEGVNFSIHHSYNKLEKRLFRGDGFVYKRNFSQGVGNEVSVVDGDSVYVFDEWTGRHLKTLSKLTGVIIYQFVYDVNNFLTKIINSYGKEYVIVRDINGKMSSITTPYGETTTFTMNNDGVLETAVSPSGKTYRVTYSVYKNFIDKFIKPNGIETKFEFLSNGWLKREIKSGGRLVRFDHFMDEEDPQFSVLERASSLERYNGMSAASANEDNRFERRKFSPFGEETIFTEGSDNSTTWESGNEKNTTSTIDDERFGDLLKRENLIERQIGNKINLQENIQNVLGGLGGNDFFSYNQIENIKKINGVTQSSIFNKSTMTFTEKSALGVEVKKTIDNHEKPISIQHGLETPISILYDADGRVVQTNQGTRNKVTYGYNAKGRKSWMKNALSQKTSYIYNADGLVGRITYADGRYTRFQYDAIGNITKVIPANGIEHLFTFNTMGLMSAYHPPEISETTAPETKYIYNTDEQLTSLIRPDGRQVKYNYEEEFGQLMSIVLGDNEKQTYSYYPLSENVKVARSPDLVRSVFTYFEKNKISSERQTIDGADETRIDFGFNNFFRLDKRVVKINGVEVGRHGIVYNDDGQVVKNADMVLTYNSVTGRPLVTRLKNIRDVKTYDSYGKLKTYKASLSVSGVPEVVLYSFSLTRDLLHRIVTKIETIQGVVTTFEYSYDNVGRLSSVTKNGIIDSSFNYDLNSNRISGTQNGISFNSTYDNQDRLISHSILNEPIKTFTYNNNGEILSTLKGSDETLFSVDALGRLKSVVLPDLSKIEYKLDWDGRRVSKLRNTTQVARYVYEDAFRVAASKEGTNIKEYLYETDINSPDQFKLNGTLYRVIKDHLGSVRLVLNATTGAVLQRIDYNEWGNIILDTNPGFQMYGFAGGIYDIETKLIKFGARDYDPEIGRWLSKDPIRFDSSDTNLYGYVLQDPINLIDPNGEDAIDAVLETIGNIQVDVGYGDYPKRDKDKPNVPDLGDLPNKCSPPGPSNPPRKKRRA